ncbi:MAG: glycoside hydrolase [Flavobacteriales bacterium CG_4_9_14_3_um_filter_32_8]|nr:MAG: glycoside hydrolase [Flavobacteriales bacterium CG_4_9_14_3_um_filter_32_8]
MQRTIFLFLYVILITSFTNAQPLVHSPEKEIDDFLCTKGIEIDSCDYPLLYDELYNWINTPYRYAGNTANGIDCSGLVKQLYNKIYNISLSGGSKDIFNQVIAISNINELIEGDIVFFKIRKNRISHVGIFLKDGFFIHSSVQRGVIISHLSEPYYQKYYFSGGRIL